MYSAHYLRTQSRPEDAEIVVNDLSNVRINFVYSLLAREQRLLRQSDSTVFFTYFIIDFFEVATKYYYVLKRNVVF